MPDARISVAIVEDNARFRKEMTQFLEGCPEFTTAGAYGGAEQRWRSCPSNRRTWC